jgi:hypothetical protein
MLDIFSKTSEITSVLSVCVLIWFLNDFCFVIYKKIKYIGFTHFFKMHDLIDFFKERSS